MKHTPHPSCIGHGTTTKRRTLQALASQQTDHLCQVALDQFDRRKIVNQMLHKLMMSQSMPLSLHTWPVSLCCIGWQIDVGPRQPYVTCSAVCSSSTQHHAVGCQSSFIPPLCVWSKPQEHHDASENPACTACDMHSMVGLMLFTTDDLHAG